MKPASGDYQCAFVINSLSGFRNVGPTKCNVIICYPVFGLYPSRYVRDKLVDVIFSLKNTSTLSWKATDASSGSAMHYRRPPLHFIVSINPLLAEKGPRTRLFQCARLSAARWWLSLACPSDMSMITARRFLPWLRLFIIIRSSRKTSREGAGIRLPNSSPARAVLAQDIPTFGCSDWIYSISCKQLQSDGIKIRFLQPCLCDLRKRALILRVILAQTRFRQSRARCRTVPTPESHQSNYNISSAVSVILTCMCTKKKEREKYWSDKHRKNRSFDLGMRNNTECKCFMDAFFPLNVRW